MPDYEKLYFMLFNSITDAVKKIMILENSEALDILLSAQKKAEAILMDGEE